MVMEILIFKVTTSRIKIRNKKNPLYAYTGLQIIKQDIIKDIKKNCFSLKEQILKSLEKKIIWLYRRKSMVSYRNGRGS